MKLTLKNKLTIFGVALISSFILPQTSEAQDNALLWKVSGKQLSQPSYLYGTIHMICPDDLEINDATKKAIGSTEQLVLELDMDDPDFMTKMTQLSLNKGMVNISDQLSEEELETMNTFFMENYKANLSQLGVMKPIALLSMVLPKALTCPQPASIEASLMELNDDKEVIGLETPAYQMGIFDMIPIEAQIGWLVEYTRDQTAMQEEFDSMFEAYQSENIEVLHDVIASNPQFADYGDILLYDRNTDWIEKITEIINKKPSFIAVGAGHLGSEKGVIALLRKSGYTVTAVK